MSLANASTVNSVFPQYSLDVVQRIAGYLLEAETLLREWIGDTKYDEIAANTSHAYYTKAQRAETLLAGMIALPDLNRRLTEQGGHVRNLGLDQMGNINTIMGKSELDAYCINLRSRARSLVRGLLLATTRTDRPEYLVRS